MSKYFSQEEFNRMLTEKCPSPDPCPFCGGRRFSTTDTICQLSVQKRLDGVEFGRSIPCGIAICSNCGHVNLFALGVLNASNDEGGK